MPTRKAPIAFGGWMCLLGLLFLLMPAAHVPVRIAAGVSAAAAIAAGLRRNRPHDRIGWHLLMVAVVLSALGTAAFGAPDWATGPVPELGVFGTVLIIAAYGLLAAVLLIFIRRRTGGARDRAALLDALTVTSGVTLLAWTFVLGPRLQDGGTLHGSMLAAIAFPVGDLLCLGVLTRLLTAAGRKPASAGLLGAGLVAMLIGDVGYELMLLNGGTLALAGLGRLALYAAAGLAALHPSMNELSRPMPAPPIETSRARLVLLGCASMIAPAILLAKMYSEPSRTIVAALSAVTFLLVLVRMADIMSSHRLALARERALRQASAALVSASDAEQVIVAVRTAVDDLLPADVPHGVVLGLAIAEPPSGDAAAQAAADRQAGTAARLVPTRDIDWAVGVRLTHFHMALRCPLVLRDRPTGDPLVGVLHVGAPTWALPGLQRSIEVLAGQAALAIERIGLNQEVVRRNSEVYFRTLVQNTSDVILIVDEADRIRYASPSARAVFGADPTNFGLTQVIATEDHQRLMSVLSAVRAGASVPREDFRAIKDLLLEMDCRDLRADRTVAGLVITLRDVTERRRLERELTHQAFHDGLTGLANRVLFADRLQHALARAARDGSVVGVLFIDLDDFKIVNDTLGHAVGDQLLIAVAERISGALRADDTAARLGGDEFACLIENVWDPNAVEDTAQRILTALGEPVPADGGQTLYAVASIGITTTPEADTADELLRQADLALYVAKGAGKNQWRRYQKHLHDAMVQRLELRSALDHAVNEGHFLLQYQPIVDLTNDEPVGFEALVRWQHPSQGVIAPASFIEVAEESGLIVPIGRWVLDQALHTVAQWRRVLPRVRQPYVSVNVSVRQFRESGFVDQVLQSLEYAGVPPHALMLEITETLLVGDHETIWQDLAALREHGVRVAIDDFGTGYSSLGYLRQRPIDVVKIDKMFIDGMVESEQQLALVDGIISLAQSQGLTVIAEGIEDPEHRDLLARLGCPLGQGFLFSSPVDGTAAIGQMTSLLAA
ncbi:EAL domain-containing protein [Actinoplanes sp. NPDC051411]|uniref:putative bifunctional diguanylate cyclase/phosphodiesterase n=1 Tax=Actinoplanes sp. NPDC051411 TaxID=3155522 RepID=UPI00342ACE42